MSDEATGANPLGAPQDGLTVAATRIRGILNAEPKGQPPKDDAPAQANPDDKPRGERGRFVKAEPVEEAKAEGADAPEAKSTEAPAPDDDSEELPEFLDALTERIGVPLEDFLERVKAKAKVGGEERAVNLKELIAGYQKGEDYTRKTAEIAEQRKAAEAERTAYQQQRERIASQLQPLVQQLEGQIVNDEQAIQNAVQMGDMQEAFRLQIIAQNRAKQLETAKQESQRIDGERQREQYQAQVRHLEEQEKYLLDKKPAWAKDPEKGKRELSTIREYLKGEGVPAQQADTLAEAIPLLMAEKAMLWDKLQKETKPKAMTELKAKPIFTKPGAAKAVENPEKQALRASFNKLRRTGDVRDAARAIKLGGFAK